MSAVLDLGLDAERLASCARHDRAAAHYAKLARDALAASDGGSISRQPLGDSWADVDFSSDGCYVGIGGAYINGGQFVDERCFSREQIDEWKRRIAAELERDKADAQMEGWA